jgi:hypothetical protein
MANDVRNPNYMAFHRSVSQELFSVKDRIRNLVTHWPTDGESKEAALRSVLRRHLPSTVIVGRGFIVTNSDSSTQIDILIVDASKPTLFKDGDLLIVTPDAVLGVIEVKTSIGTQLEMTTALTKLSNIEVLCRSEGLIDTVWTGLFIYKDTPEMANSLLNSLAETYRETNGAVNCISAGINTFIRFWNAGETVGGDVGPYWHSYALPEVAPSYFMGNLIDWIGSIDNNTSSFAWFPAIGGKEQFFIARMVLPHN